MWEDQRDIRPLETHAGTLTFSTGSPHLQQWNTGYEYLGGYKLVQTSPLAVSRSLPFTFCVQLRQRPSQEALLLVVGSRSLPLLLQQVFLSPPLRVVFPQGWNLQATQTAHIQRDTWKKNAQKCGLALGEFRFNVTGFLGRTLKYSASSSGGFRSSSSNRISSFVISAQYGSTDAQNLKFKKIYIKK